MKKIILASLLAASVATAAFADFGNNNGAPAKALAAAAYSGSAAQKENKYSGTVETITIYGTQTATTGCSTSSPTKAVTGGTAPCYSNVLDCATSPTNASGWTCALNGNTGTVAAVAIGGTKTSSNGNLTVTYTSTCTNTSSTAGTYTCKSAGTRENSRNNNSVTLSGNSSGNYSS